MLQRSVQKTFFHQKFTGEKNFLRHLNLYTKIFMGAKGEPHIKKSSGATPGPTFQKLAWGHGGARPSKNLLGATLGP
jgi:hypothetical protein